MLNAESRKYFTRVYLVSGTVSPRNLHRDSQLPYVRRCLQFNGSNAELLDYMKTAPSATLSKCHYMDRILHIEGPNAIAPFITKTPDEIYDSDEAPVIDAMYTFASQVNSLSFDPVVFHPIIYFTSSKFTQYGFRFSLGICKNIPRHNSLDIPIT